MGEVFLHSTKHTVRKLETYAFSVTQFLCEINISHFCNLKDTEFGKVQPSQIAKNHHKFRASKIAKMADTL